MEIEICVYLNKIIEQDHPRGEAAHPSMLGFKPFAAVQDTLVGIELLHMIKKRQMVIEKGEAGLIGAAQFYVSAA
jgi:transposase-like protein